MVRERVRKHAKISDRVLISHKKFQCWVRYLGTQHWNFLWNTNMRSEIFACFLTLPLTTTMCASSSFEQHRAGILWCQSRASTLHSPPFQFSFEVSSIYLNLNPEWPHLLSSSSLLSLQLTNALCVKKSKNRMSPTMSEYPAVIHSLNEAANAHLCKKYRKWGKLRTKDHPRSEVSLRASALPLTAGLWLLITRQVQEWHCCDG